MKTITLGKTGITTGKNAFGALPIQRISAYEAVNLLHCAFDAGITFFDTARGYTDSEEKLGLAFNGRTDIIIATKSPAQNGGDLLKDLDTSLGLLKRDYIDIFQFHNPRFCPRPGGADGLYDAALKAKAAGKIRHIGISQHSHIIATEVIESGLYDTLQYPLSYISDDKDVDVAKKCLQAGVGFIAMKALAGGLITNSAAACAWLGQFDVLPIWGIQRHAELDEFIGHINNPPTLTADLMAAIDEDRTRLAGEFCRGCGYCLPCPAHIPINMAARMGLFLRRFGNGWLAPEGQEQMARIKNCINCGHCSNNCPYGLDVVDLLRRNYEDYCGILSGEIII